VVLYAAATGWRWVSLTNRPSRRAPVLSWVREPKWDGQISCDTRSHGPCLRRCYESGMGDVVQTLRRSPLFSDLEAVELDALAEPMHERTFAPGETATVEGEPGDGFYVVESGEAVVTVRGQPQRTLRTGDVFGEIALLTGSGRAATIMATSELRCYWLAPLDFRAVVEANPGIAWKLVQSMVDTLS
jgi:Cyclic nucleotide-binding domain